MFQYVSVLPVVIMKYLDMNKYHLSYRYQMHVIQVMQVEKQFQKMKEENLMEASNLRRMNEEGWKR